MRAINVPVRVVSLPMLHPRHWPSTIVLATMFALYFLAGSSLVGLDGPEERANARGTIDPPAAIRAAPTEAPPKVEPFAVRDIPPQDAVAINAAVPVSAAPNPAARAFRDRAASRGDRLRALECLTAAVYYEAGSEPVEGQRAVAQVVLNRVRHPAYPSSVCGVVFEGAERATGCQFTFTCDGSLRRAPSIAGWARARRVAETALAGKVYAPVGYATHYHTNWVVPYWSDNLVKAANVGTHIFYRWSGGWGRPPAFAKRHSGREPEYALMRPLTSDPSTLADAVGPAVAGPESASADLGSNGGPRGNIATFERSVLRRYEPVTRQGVATLIASQERDGDKVDAAYRWAMTGAGAAAKQAPLGAKTTDVRSSATICDGRDTGAGAAC